MQYTNLLNITTKYDGIIADPPWNFETYSNNGDNKSPQSKYDTMPINDICAMPIANLCAPNCLLMLWTTSPHLQLGLLVLESWGFKYKTMATWLKTTPNNNITFGTGYILRSAMEPILIGTRGNPKITDKSVRNVLIANRREHSRKPDEQYLMMERLIGTDKKYIEIFSRTNRANWDAFGNQCGHFN